MALSSQVQKSKFYQPSPKSENGSPPYSPTPLKRKQPLPSWFSDMQNCAVLISQKCHQTSAFVSCSVLNKPKQNQMYHAWHVHMQMQMMAEKASFQTAEISLGDSCCCCPLTSSRLKDRNEGAVGATSALTASQRKTPFCITTVVLHQLLLFLVFCPHSGYILLLSWRETKVFSESRIPCAVKLSTWHCTRIHDLRAVVSQCWGKWTTTFTKLIIDLFLYCWVFYLSQTTPTIPPGTVTHTHTHMHRYTYMHTHVWCI